MVRIVVIDRQETFCNSIKAAVVKFNHFEVCGMGKDSYDALRLIEKYKPDIAVIEFEMPDVDPLKLLVSIKARSKKTNIIFITRCAQESDVITLAKSGVPGCVDRDCAHEHIGEACGAVSENKPYITRDAAIQLYTSFSKLLRRLKHPIQLHSEYSFQQNAKPFLLSHTELKIAVYISEGLSNKEIVKKLHLSEGTIRNYISSIMKKSGLQHRTQVAIYTLEGGFIEKIKKLPHDTQNSTVNSQTDEEDEWFDTESYFEDDNTPEASDEQKKTNSTYR
ncbi:MAG: response regulator transcription factor [Spirochaetaceae bacterium]|jgi:DNA-binding NarL/FixJ family response regulator|nr:response regulator transcription factor [Spirochaetaceae bacterium]